MNFDRHESGLLKICLHNICYLLKHLSNFFLSEVFTAPGAQTLVQSTHVDMGFTWTMCYSAWKADENRQQSSLARWLQEKCLKTALAFLTLQDKVSSKEIFGLRNKHQFLGLPWDMKEEECHIRDSTK